MRKTLPWRQKQTFAYIISYSNKMKCLIILMQILNPLCHGKGDTYLVIIGSIGEKGRSIVNKEVISRIVMTDLVHK